MADHTASKTQGTSWDRGQKRCTSQRAGKSAGRCPWDEEHHSIQPEPTTLDIQTNEILEQHCSHGEELLGQTKLLMLISLKTRIWDEREGQYLTYILVFSWELQARGSKIRLKKGRGVTREGSMRECCCSCFHQSVLLLVKSVQTVREIKPGTGRQTSGQRLRPHSRTQQPSAGLLHLADLCFLLFDTSSLETGGIEGSHVNTETLPALNHRPAQACLSSEVYSQHTRSAWAKARFQMFSCSPSLEMKASSRFADYCSNH